MTFIKKEHAKNLILQESQKHIGFEWLYKSVYDRVSKCAEVEAIPIEWLHSIMERQLIFAMNSEMEGTTTVKDGVIHCVSGALACQVLANVIELWEKEKEAEHGR